MQVWVKLCHLMQDKQFDKHEQQQKNVQFTYSHYKYGNIKPSAKHQTKKINNSL